MKSDIDDVYNPCSGCVIFLIQLAAPDYIYIYIKYFFSKIVFHFVHNFKITLNFSDNELGKDSILIYG